MYYLTTLLALQYVAYNFNLFGWFSSISQNFSTLMIQRMNEWNLYKNAKIIFSCHCWYTGQICKKGSKFRAASFFFEFWINIIHHNIDRLYFCDQVLLSLFTTQGDFEVLLLLYIYTSNVVVRNDYLLHLLAPKDSRQKCYFFLFYLNIKYDF